MYKCLHERICKNDLFLTITVFHATQPLYVHAAIFTCRDFWSDECVKDMIMCSFVFWQQQDVSPEGRTFISYYKVSTLFWMIMINPVSG